MTISRTSEGVTQYHRSADNKLLYLIEGSSGRILRTRDLVPSELQEFGRTIESFPVFTPPPPPKAPTPQLAPAPAAPAKAD